MQIKGPSGNREIDEFGEQFLFHFINRGRKWYVNDRLSPFAADMIGSMIADKKVTRSLWEQVTDAMQEVGLIHKKRGSPTQVKFVPPILPLLIDKPI